MIHGIYTAGLGALGQSVRLGVAANNLANLDTPGFRRDQLVFSERLNAAIEDAPHSRYYNALTHRFGGAPYIQGIVHDPRPGILQQTARNLDFALEVDDGYFLVQDRLTEERFVTRAGQFEINAEGQLVTPDGRYTVLSGDAAAIELDGPPEVGPGGEILAGGEGQIGVFRVSDPTALRKYGHSLFRIPGGAQPEAHVNPRVRQGFLERSSANPVEEMVELIAVARAIESNLQMLRHQDAELDRMMNTMGRR